jgi:hypothetical protein
MAIGQRSPVAVVAILFALCGCVAVTTDMTTFQDLMKYREDGRTWLRVLATDSSLYEVSEFTIRDSSLDITAVQCKGDERIPFTGRLPFSRCVYIQGMKPSIGRTILATGFLCYVGYSLAAASQEHGLDVHRILKGGSCPYVYAWDGDHYVLQGEVFGTAFGKALETHTACMLPAAAVGNKKVLVRVANERPETHFLNAVHLFGYRRPAGSTVVLDNEHHAWPVIHPRVPLHCPPELENRDGKVLTSDAGNTRPGGGHRDVVYLTLPSPGDGHTGSLVVHAINSHLDNAVFDMVFGYLGKESLRFIDRVEHDPQLVGELGEWIHDCSLTVEVWRGGTWVFEGEITPEANVTSFTRVVRVHTEAGDEDSLRIRLSSLADLWSLDAVELDWTPAEQLTPHPMRMLSAIHSSTGSVVEPLAARDGEYTVLVPEERIDMEFAAAPSASGEEWVYALDAAGYLYEWPGGGGFSSYPAFQAVAMNSGTADRVEVVCFLVKHKEIFLALIYDYWRN